MDGSISHLAAEGGSLTQEPFPDLDSSWPTRSGGGVGIAFGHHGEILQGVFEDTAGQLCRGLVTLPCYDLVSRATFAVSQDDSEIRLRPAGRWKAGRAARLALDHLGFEGVGGTLTVESSIPNGYGYGSSTADVMASLRAVCDALQLFISRTDMARLAVIAEEASDGVAFESEAVLFAQRKGEILEHFGNVLPPVVVVGCNPSPGKPVDTLDFTPAQYDDLDVEYFRTLRGLLRYAVAGCDPLLLGRVATASASINQRHLPNESFETAMRLANSLEACGVQVSHSGTVIGLLFSAARHDIGSVTDRGSKALADATGAATYLFGIQ